MAARREAGLREAIAIMQLGPFLFERMEPGVPAATALSTTRAKAGWGTSSKNIIRAGGEGA